MLAAITGYLIGSVPTGYLVGRRYGIDIREHGSGNIGATNVLRVLGKKPGYFVFVCDALKGFLAVQIAFTTLIRISPLHHRFVAFPGSGDGMWSPTSPHDYYAQLAIGTIIAAIACIIGHNFPVWLRFRGGKGVATTIGTLLGLMPQAFLVVAAVWLVVFFLSRYVSLASILAATVLPLAVWMLGAAAGFGPGTSTRPMLYFSIVAAALVWVRHRTNIQRLLNGTEARFIRKPKV